jgi:hypothetical protein
MPDIVSEHPVRLGSHGGEEHWHVGGVANQVAAGTNELIIGVRNHLGVGQFHEAAIVLNQLLCIERWEVRGMKQ